MSTALLQSPLAQWLSSQRLPGVQLYIGRMEQGGQLQAAGRHAHPAARDRAITPEYYRGTDTLNGPVHRTKDSGRRSASFASPQVSSTSY